MKKFFGIITLFIIAGLTIASCDLDAYVGSGAYECDFVNKSSYDITVRSAKSSNFKTFTVKKGKTTNLRTNDEHIYFDYSNDDKVEVYVLDGTGKDGVSTAGWGSRLESRAVFRNKTDIYQD